MITIAEYSLDQILPHIGKPRINLFDYKVKMNSSRLKLFSTSQTCVGCKRTGNVFFLQSVTFEPPHLNLYHRSNNGNLLLMTQDHILPKSKGGSDRQDNLQVMCFACNHQKGNRIIVTNPRRIPLPIFQGKKIVYIPFPIT